jgi:tellurite resistance protein
MAITDGKLDENERKLLLSLGKHLGLKEAAINNSIKITLKQKIH